MLKKAQHLKQYQRNKLQNDSNKQIYFIDGNKFSHAKMEVLLPAVNKERV